MDPKRVNEFGTSGEENTPGTEIEGTGLEDRPGDHNEQGSKSAQDKKQD